MAVPYTFGSATSSIPLSQLDSNFATGITLGNTTVYLGNTTTSFGNVTLTNVTISSVSTAITPSQGGTGLVTIPANNVILGNGTSNVTVVAPGTSGNVLTSNGTTWSSSTISAASVSAAGSTTQVQYNNGGAFAGSANLTFNGTTLTAAGLAGPHDGTVGATTPNTGSFTTLAASSTVSGTGFSTYLASPPAIGGTAPNTGNFTTLTTSSTVTLNGGTANGVTYLNGSKVLTSGSALTFDGTNLLVAAGLGASIRNISSSTQANLRLGSTFTTGTGGANTDWSIVQSFGAYGDLVFRSGTAESDDPRTTGSTRFQFLRDGTAIWSVGGSEQMRLTSTGLGIGTSSPTTKLEVRDTNPTILLSNSASRYGFLQWENSGSTLRIGTDTAFGIRFDTNASQRMLIDSAGNLGLGVTPSAWSLGKALQVNGSAVFNDGSSSSYWMNNAYYNGGFKYFGSSGASSYAMRTDGSHQWFIAASGTAGTAISFTQAMTLDASGNLGIGTTSPASYNAGGNSLVVGGSGNYKGMTIASAIEGNIYFADGTSGTETYRGIVGYNHTSDFMTFYTAANERARIDSSGNLLVGTTTSLNTERVAIVAAGVNALYTKNTGGDFNFNCWNSATTGNNQFIQFITETSPTARGSITYNRGAGLVAYNVTSDYRAKDIIGPVTDSGALIDSTPVYMGKMKGATQERPMFIAHETPEYAHTGEKDAVDADGNPVYQQMDASALIPVMWAEIQSLRQRLAAANL